jgi:hypothetical protein
MERKRENKFLNFIEYFDRFIHESYKGKRLQKNGKKLRKGSVKKYFYTRRLLVDFSTRRNFELRLRQVNKINKREMVSEKNYWKKFYRKFTDYLYNEIGLYDNYLGSNIKNLRTFKNIYKSIIVPELKNCGCNVIEDY